MSVVCVEHSHVSLLCLRFDMLWLCALDTLSILLLGNVHLFVLSITHEVHRNRRAF